MRQSPGCRLAEPRFFSEIGSTNEEALNWLGEGAPDAGLVFADTQSAGRGRFKRRWVTNPGSALALTLILRPDKNHLEHLALFSPMAALALCSVLETDYLLNPCIKWPNDVLLDGKKTCGILVEAGWQGSELEGLVIGIGVNVAPEAVPPAEELLFPATCINAHLKNPASRPDLLKKLILQLLGWREKIGSTDFLQEFEKRLAFRNEWVKIQHSDQKFQIGKIKGIDKNGDLILELKNGQQEKITAGDVHLRPHDFDYNGY